MATEPAGLPEPREPRVPLSRERVIEAAGEIADKQGIDALTMRGLGQRLGVEAMSLYHYVAGKDELYEGLLDLVEAEIAVPDEDVPWKDRLRTIAISSFRALRRHPWAASLMSTSVKVRPGRLRIMESMLGTLRQAGFSPDDTDHAYHALDAHITGFTLWLANMKLPDDLTDLAAGFLRELPADQFPYLVEHIHQHMKPPPPEGSPSEFEFGLDLILDGLERMLPRT